MKTALLILTLPLVAVADDAELAAKIGKHQEGARNLSDKQDELAADVQQLTIEQTVPEVIKLLREVEDAMDEASERLWEHNTGGKTIAAETDVIEKIYAAAKEKQKQCQGGKPGEQGEQPGGGMLGMMERMMGIEPGGQQPGKKPGDKGGEGMTGDSNSANQQQGGAVSGKVEKRRVPKGSGSAGKSVPREFQDALRAYNRGAEKLTP